MLKSFSHLAILLSIITMLPNCGSYPCGTASLDYGLIGFTDQESQNIILRKFEKNSNFVNTLDTVILQAQFRRSNDTLNLATSKADELLLSKYDYEMYFTSASRLYRINNIVEEQGTIKRSIFRPTKEGCINKITHLTINGQIYSTVRFNRIYLVK